jgi:hypothetical protein
MINGIMNFKFVSISPLPCTPSRVLRTGTLKLDRNTFHIVSVCSELQTTTQIHIISLLCIGARGNKF